MPNIVDYIDWRGDIPFSVDPFNEVDNLIMSMLSYVDFTDILTDLMPGETMSLAEAGERFFSLHSEQEQLAMDTFTKWAPFLMPKMAGSRRFSQVRLCNYVDIISEHREEQMAAVTILPGDGTIYVSFRGTDSTMVGWKEDFNLSFMPETSGQRAAADYMSRFFSMRGPDIRVGGHSKGGNFAVYAAAFCSEQAKKRIMEVWSNDGPGFLEEVIRTEAYQSILPRIRSIIPAYSVFGLLLGSEYPHKVIASSQKGIYQHDGMSWEVLGSHFVEVPGTTQGSVIWEKTIRNWVAGFNLEERENFVNLVYDLIQTSGATTTSQLKEEGLKNTLGIMRAYTKLPAEDQKVVRDTLLALLRSGAEVIAEETAPPKPEHKMADTLADLSMNMTAAVIDRLGLTQKLLHTDSSEKDLVEEPAEKEELQEDQVKS